MNHINSFLGSPCFQLHTRLFSFGILRYAFLFLLMSFVVVTIVTSSISMVVNTEATIAPTTEVVWKDIPYDVSLTNIVFWVLVMGSTLFVVQLNKCGQGGLWNFLTGKYLKPKDQERIFMFLDLKSSTAIAEELGHRRFFEFISDFIADATIPILNNHGEIYQYVGDEIVISWRIDKGQFDPYCIQCFFDIKNQIEQLSGKYLEKFDVVPVFKAGLHYGNVTVGEVGVAKKDLIFSGDVLNTTSHIQTKCNEYDAELLISSDLAGKLTAEAYELNRIGDVWLKGKQVQVELNSVHLMVSPVGQLTV